MATDPKMPTGYVHTLAYECRRAKVYRHSRDGMLQEGQRVAWRGKKYKYKGTIVEVIPPHRYPSKWPKLKLREYYRETESYVVLSDCGKYFWPNAGILGSISS